MKTSKIGKHSDIITHNLVVNTDGDIFTIQFSNESGFCLLILICFCL